MKTRFVSMGLLGLLLAACTVETADEAPGESADAIVRGRTETRFPQVVFLHIERFNGARTRCTGVYAAPRVVITAAHCIQPDTIPGQFFVYHGDDYATDVAALPAIPPPGSPSPWSRAETWAVHPDWSPELIYPDLAVVYLDRKLPFAPMPLLRERVGRRFVGDKVTTVGWGANVALDAAITQVQGVGVKRSGRQILLGSPTAADFVPADPNPGLLVPEIRADLIKLDGTAPRPNTCAGDSGGPFLIEKHGVPHVGGINFFTGQFCEGYSMYTRIDPFLDFFDDAFERAGSAPVVPRLECVYERPSGEFTAYFGYRNDNGITVDIPYDRHDNSFPQDVNGERPSAFAPGDHPFQFGVDFEACDNLRWKLDPPRSRQTVLNVDESSPRCDVNDQQFICAQQCEASLAAECDDGSFSFQACQEECVSFTAAFFTGCETEWNTYLRCHAAVPPAAQNWSCEPGAQSLPAPPLCEAELTEAFTCAGFIF